jgi:hypothetical protein
MGATVMGGRGSAGRARHRNPDEQSVTVRPQPAPAVAEPAPLPTDRPTLVEQLSRATSRDQARAALDGLTVAQLKDLAANLRDGGITVPGRPTKEALTRAIIEYTAGRRLDSEAISRAGNPPTEQVRPEPPRPTPVSGALSDQPLAENGWGYNPSLPVHYHEDGPIGTAVRYMGRDARMDVDGQPLGNVLGRTATDVVTGRRSAQQALDEFKTIRDRLPAGSQARAQLDAAIRDMDAPASPTPTLPAATPTPLRQLMSDLHAIPLVRRDPGVEQAALRTIAEDFTAGKTGGLRMVDAVRRLANRRHESLGECGKFDIDRAVGKAVTALSNMDRKSLYPPSRQ